MLRRPLNWFALLYLKASLRVSIINGATFSQVFLGWVQSSMLVREKVAWRRFCFEFFEAEQRRRCWNTFSSHSFFSWPRSSYQNKQLWILTGGKKDNLPDLKRAIVRVLLHFNWVAKWNLLVGSQLFFLIKINFFCHESTQADILGKTNHKITNRQFIKCCFGC